MYQDKQGKMQEEMFRVTENLYFCSKKYKTKRKSMVLDGLEVDFNNYPLLIK